MFNAINIQNRLRYPVRGRVLVFTTSSKVEYLEESLRFSYVLFNFPGPLTGFQGYVFTVEMQDGYLTFDNESYVKLLEVSTFRKYHFSPTDYTLLSTADPLPPVPSFAGDLNFIDSQTDANFNETCAACYFKVSYKNYDGTTNLYAAQFSGPGGARLATQDCYNTFGHPDVFKGSDKYPGFQYMAANSNLPNGGII